MAEGWRSMKGRETAAVREEFFDLGANKGIISIHTI